MKLAGLRVIDLSLFIPGPYLTMALADHGAEVIKVEPPGGDPARAIGESDGRTSVFFRNFNRGKRSVVLDLKTAEGRQALLDLVDGADVFVEAFRPGVIHRLGFDYARLSDRNPRLVYCSISAFGQDGPYRERPAHDLAVQSIAGALSILPAPDGSPLIPAIPAADIFAALQGLSGVLMALYRREHTGRGDFIDISMQESILGATRNVLGPVLTEGRQPVPAQERSLGGAAFYNVYETADGRHLVLGGQELKFVRTLLGALGRADLIDLCEQGPGPHQQPVIAFLRDTFRQKRLAEWLPVLGGHDICFAPVNTMSEALEDPHLRHRGGIHQDEAGRRHLAPVIRFLGEPAAPCWSVPELGEATADYADRASCNP